MAIELLERWTSGYRRTIRHQQLPSRRRRVVPEVAVAAAVLLATLAVATRGSTTTGENVHRTGADCARCHTVRADLLSTDRDTAAKSLVPNLEAVCNGCHADEGPSHKTGMPPKRPIPNTLPLAADGTITCATCHLVHGEATTAESFERIDNRRGQLCLTCHELSELE